MTERKEQTVSIVKAYSVGNPDSIVFVIPKELQEQIQCNPKGKKYLVKFDDKKRIIYEPIEDSTAHADMIIDMIGIIWQPRHGKHGLFEVAINMNDPQCKRLLEALRMRENHCVNEGYSLWILDNGTVARRAFDQGGEQ